MMGTTTGEGQEPGTPRAIHKRTKGMSEGACDKEQRRGGGGGQAAGAATLNARGSGEETNQPWVGGGC